MQLNPQYIRPLETLTISGSTVTVTLKNAPRFEGDISELGNHTRSHKDVSFLSSQVEAGKVGVFPVFIPTNKEQRVFLSALVGKPVQAGECYTFGSIPGARAFAKMLTDSGVKFSKDNNFAIGHTEPQAQAPATSQEEQVELGM